MRPGGSFPKAFASAQCLQNASLSREDKSLVLAGVRGSSGIAEIAQQMRRLFGPTGGSGRQDVLYVAADEGKVISRKGTSESWAGYRKAKEKSKRKTKVAGRVGKM